MSLKLKDLSLEQVMKIVTEYDMKPMFTGQNPYIASSSGHEILVALMPNGLYQVSCWIKKK